MDPTAVLRELLGRPGLSSVGWVTQQYDSTVGSDTVVGSGHGAAVLRIKGTRLGLVAATDANATVAALDPWLGAAMSVCEAVRNVVVTGARPLGITDCLNFGDPEKPEAFWQLGESVRGIGDAARAFGLPVIERQRQPVQRVCGRSASCPRPRSASSACSMTSTGGSDPPSPPRATSSCWLGESAPGLAGSRLCATSPAPRPTTSRRRSTSRARAALHAASCGGDP